MDFFDFHKFTEKEADEAHTLISMTIGSINHERHSEGFCYVCQKLIPTKNCEICHKNICDHCAFVCNQCHRTICKLCLHDNDEEISICYKCLP